MSKDISSIIISVSSDIGVALGKKWQSMGWKIYGTYRTESKQVDVLKKSGNFCLTKCDLNDVTSVKEACIFLKDKCSTWDVLVFASGTQEPVGCFDKINFDDWQRGVEVNLLSQLRILHYLLPFRNKNASLKEPVVLFFAGGCVNGATACYSSYNLSKIALIKMCEFLDMEIPDTKFVIVGPGWVKTKIHESTIKAGADLAKDGYQKTLDRFKSNDFVEMKKVVDCCTWLVTTNADGVSGRNFSVASDAWGSRELEEVLQQDKDMYKLRRHNNNWRI
jgi:NAD(P)-dependent dehydrogenase (short-subunit alcohol dehydrogenase family)